MILFFFIIILSIFIFSAYYIININGAIKIEYRNISNEFKNSIEKITPTIEKTINISNIHNIFNETKKQNIVEENQKEETKQTFNEYKAIVSYYTYLPECTGSGSGITASGKKVSETSIAIPRNDNILKFGVKMEFKEFAPNYMSDYNSKYLTRIADDTGSPKHIRKMDNGVYRLDVFCPKFPNETNSEYHKRVSSYGKTETTFRIYN